MYIVFYCRLLYRCIKIARIRADESHSGVTRKGSENNVMRVLAL